MVTRDTIGREPITIVEIDQDFCENVYGVPPCMAAGAFKCYNTYRTCQDVDNYANGDPLTLRFVTKIQSTGLPRTMTFIPILREVDTVPTEINVGDSSEDANPLGNRARISVMLDDFPYHDRLVDPYWDERTFTAVDQGTFWSKWISRNPYHEGRALRVIEGYVGQTLDEMITRHFIIERIEGPADGRIKIVAKDPLSLLESARAVCPDVNTGVLVADYLAVDMDMTFVLSPAGIGDDEYETSGVINVAGELISFTRVADTLTLTARGLRGTEITDHSLGDVVQQVYVANARIDEVLQELMIDYGNVPADFIDVDAWDDETTLWLSGFTMEAWIVEPTGVGQLVAELLQQASCFVWWDDRDRLISFRAVRPYFPLVDQPPYEITDAEHIIEGSLSIQRRPEDRVSHLYIYYAQQDPTKAVDDISNYARLRVIGDPTSATDLEYGQARIKRIYARWFGEAGDGPTNAVASRIIERLRDVPYDVTFRTDAKDEVIKAGEVIRISHHSIVDFDGAPLPTLLQVMYERAIKRGHIIEFKARPYLYSTSYGFIVPDTHPDYDAATTDQRELGCWIAPDVTGFDNGDPPYRIL